MPRISKWSIYGSFEKQIFSEKGWTGGEGKDTDKVILIVGSDMVIRYRLGILT